MQSLSTAVPGRSYTIKWMFAAPEILAYMRQLQIEEGSTVQLIQRCMHGVIIGVHDIRLLIGDEIAECIKV